LVWNSPGGPLRQRRSKTKKTYPTSIASRVSRADDHNQRKDHHQRTERSRARGRDTDVGRRPAAAAAAHAVRPQGPKTQEGMLCATVNNFKGHGVRNREAISERSPSVVRVTVCPSSSTCPSAARRTSRTPRTHAVRPQGPKTQEARYVQRLDTSTWQGPWRTKKPGHLRAFSIGRAGGGSCIQRWWTGGPGRTCSRGGYPRPGGSSPGAVAGRHGAASLCAGTGEGDLDLWVAVIRGRFYHRDRRGT
jgi:hypothetical protein